MAYEEGEGDHSRRATSINDNYPLDSKCYKILEEIGRGVSAVVYKAICIPRDSVVAIKDINLDNSKERLENVEREAKMMTLLSHPNTLRAHCSFTVGTRLWVVMPFMSGGSLQSIMASSYPDGLPEPFIASVLKEILSALSYLHDHGLLHRDIKAGNILVDSNGSVKLADFGVSASVSESTQSSSAKFTEMAGTPYWMAPEVIHSHTGYGFKADIWSFGITALELFHGRPPLSHLSPSKSIMMKFTELRFLDHYDKTKASKNKKFSKSFKNMVGLCLHQEPSKRQTAEKLLKHSFFKNCKGPDFFIKNVLQGVPAVEERFKAAQGHCLKSKSSGEDEGEGDGASTGENVKKRRISGWNFNEEGFELDPVFPADEELGKQVASEDGENVEGGDVAATMLKSMVSIVDSLAEQRQSVLQCIAMLNGSIGQRSDMPQEDQLMQDVAQLKMNVESEKNNNNELEMELKLRKQLQLL